MSSVSFGIFLSSGGGSHRPIKIHQRHTNKYSKYQPLPALPGSYSKRMDQDQKPPAQELKCAHVSCFQTGGHAISDGFTVVSCRLQEKSEV